MWTAAAILRSYPCLKVWYFSLASFPFTARQLYGFGGGTFVRGGRLTPARSDILKHDDRRLWRTQPRRRVRTVSDAGRAN